MPGGPSELGFVYFLATKFAGYTAYCNWAIKPRLELSSPDEISIPSSAKAGVARTLIGAAVGAIVGIGFWKIPAFSNHDTLSDILFFGLLIPVRIGEWLLLLRTVYRQFHIGEFAWKNHAEAKLVTGGIFTSFALDFVGLFAAFVVPGGFWVC